MDVAKRCDVSLGDLRSQRTRTRNRLGDDLDERDACPVVVDQGVGRSVDATGRAADVERLAGVLLEMDPLDADAVDSPSTSTSR